MTKEELRTRQLIGRMTDIELATIESDEMHPLHELACVEVDERALGRGREEGLKLELEYEPSSFLEEQEAHRIAVAEEILELEERWREQEDEFEQRRIDEDNLRYGIGHYGYGDYAYDDY